MTFIDYNNDGPSDWTMNDWTLQDLSTINNSYRIDRLFMKLFRNNNLDTV